MSPSEDDASNAPNQTDPTAPITNAHATFVEPAIPSHSSSNEEEHHQPTDSKGWDGKLRIRGALGGTDPVTPEVGSDNEDEEEGDGRKEARVVTGEVVKGAEIAPDEDLLDDYPEDTEEIDLVHCRISSIPALRLDRFTKVQRLCLRQNSIEDPTGLSVLAPTIVDLDLYDNLIGHIKGLEELTKLTSLDLSFNKIKHIKRVNHLKELKNLYFVQNTIRRIEGLEGLEKLTNLELAANRIREIEGLETLTALEQLWLGKNKITELKGIDHLQNLKILSIQSNRITQITGLTSLPQLEELYISHNALAAISGLDHNTQLRVLDISNNGIDHLTNISHLTKLEELWASNNQLASFGEIERELKDKKELNTVYFEGNPLQMNAKATYRGKVRLYLPQLQQIDATFVRVS